MLRFHVRRMKVGRTRDKALLIKQRNSGTVSRGNLRSYGQMGNMAWSQGLAKSLSTGRYPWFVSIRRAHSWPAWVTITTQGSLRSELEKLPCGFDSYQWGSLTMHHLLSGFPHYSSLEFSGKQCWWTNSALVDKCPLPWLLVVMQMCSWPAKPKPKSSRGFWERRWCHPFPFSLSWTWVGCLESWEQFCHQEMVSTRKGHKEHRDQALTGMTEPLIHCEKPPPSRILAMFETQRALAEVSLLGISVS